jgi:hypothetical protein
VERIQIETGGGNATATLAAIVGLLALAAGPVAFAVQRYSQQVTLHVAIAAGGAAAAGLGILALLLARRGRLRAQRNVLDAGAGAARFGRVVGTLALCVGIAAGIALATEVAFRHFE